MPRRGRLRSSGGALDAELPHGLSSTWTGARGERIGLHAEGFFEALGVGEHVDVGEDVVGGLVLRLVRDLG